MMSWNTPSEFFFMGGYWFYVWGSYLVALICMVGEPLLARRRHRQALRDLAGAEVHDDADAGVPARPVGR